MNKIIVALTGSPDLKNRFDETVCGTVDNWRYYRRNRNAINSTDRVAVMLTREIGVTGEIADRFANSLANLANKQLGFREAKIRKEIQEFLKHEKADLLVLHGLGTELTAKLIQEFGIRTIHLSHKEDIENHTLAEVTIHDGELFEEKILEVLKSFETVEKSEKKSNKKKVENKENSKNG